MIYEIKPAMAAGNLFGDWPETLIWSCLQETMGTIYGDAPDKPASAMAILADFCFFAGEPKEELVSFRPDWCKKEFLIYVPQNEGWAKLIRKVFGDRASEKIRYAIKKEPDVFDWQYLQSVVEHLPGEYACSTMTEALFKQCKEIPWCSDFVGQYDTFTDFCKSGLCVLILKDGEIVSGASSYTSYREGIEIEIDTREDFRRKGLATICGAALILECQKRGLYPSWDAQNLWSVALAEKLGYHFDHEYVVYEVRNSMGQ